METVEEKRKASTDKMFGRIRILIIVLIVIGEVINVQYFLFKPNWILETLLNVLVASYLLMFTIQYFKKDWKKSFLFAMFCVLITVTNVLILFLG